MLSLASQSVWCWLLSTSATERQARASDSSLKRALRSSTQAFSRAIQSDLPSTGFV